MLYSGGKEIKELLLHIMELWSYVVMDGKREKKSRNLSDFVTLLAGGCNFSVGVKTLNMHNSLEAFKPTF